MVHCAIIATACVFTSQVNKEGDMESVRMNRTDRLLAIILELQGKGRQRAEDLAETFETSKRTIYRDIQSLGEAGVPIVSIPGLGYSLMKGYFLPPLSFTTDEATMLMLGSDLMARSFDAQYRSAALSARRKIENVLPEKLREEVHYLQNSIRFVTTDAMEHPTETEKLLQVRRAILQHNTIRFCYFTRHPSSPPELEGDPVYTARHPTSSVTTTPTPSTREADPYGLVHFFNAWHVVAYCHLRQDIRNFRLDRIDDLVLLPRTFQRPANFKMGESHSDQRRRMFIRVVFDKEVARWVRESRSYYTASEEETPEGLLVTLNPHQESEVLQWLLSWGSHVRVLEPETLRRRIADEAQAMRQNNCER
jgi:predicted DNA-binding transcriptional regulator YafY